MVHPPIGEYGKQGRASKELNAEIISADSFDARFLFYVEMKRVKYII